MPINTFLGNSSSYLLTSISNITPEGVDNILNIVQEALDNGDVGGGNFVPLTDVGANNGVCPLDGNGQVPANRLNNVSLDQLTDVNTAGVNDGHVLKWSTQDSQWVSETFNLDDCDNVTITNPVATQALKYNGTQWINEKVFMSDLDDTNIVSPADKDVLIYQNSKFENRALTISDITNLQTQLNSKVNTSEYTAVGDLAYADAANSVTRLPIGGQGKVLRVSNTQVPEWGDPITTLASLSDVDVTGVQNNNTILYNSTNNTWEDKALTTDVVAEGLDVNRQYFTNQRVNDYLLNNLNNQDILFNNNGNIEGLAKGVNGRYLRSGNTAITYSQIAMEEILNHSPMVRLNTTIPANSSVNMLDWLGGAGDIFNNMIIPGNDVNPFFWGTRGDADYGQWKVQNTSGVDIVLDRINCIPCGVFIMFQFIRTLINNIMDDNLNDGTVLVRVNGINHRQTGGNAQIFNTGIDALGKIRTLTAGTGITITQNADTITITGNVTISNLADLADVSIITPVNNQFLLYSTGNNKWTNQTITTDDIPSTLTNPYCTSTAIQTRLTEILTGGGDLLYRNGVGNAARLAIGAANSFLRTNGAGNSPVWTTASTSDISEGTNLYYTNTRVDNYLKSILTTNEDILIRRGGNIARLPVAVNHNDILKYNGITGEIAWGANAATASIASLNDVSIQNAPIQDRSFLMYNPNNGTGIDTFWVDSLAEIGDITGLQTALDSKVNTSTLTTAGDLLYHDGTNLARLPRGTPGQILRVNGGGTNIGWENQVVVRNYLSELLDCSIATLANNQALVYNSTSEKWENKTLNTSFITENTNLYYTDTRVDSRLSSKYSAKGRIQVGTGSSSYAEQAAPTADNQLPFSDIGNILNTTGISWRLATLNDITSVSINTPVNGNALIYNGLNWVNSTQVSTNTANIATVSGRVDTLEANVFIQTINPAVTPSTLTFNQLNTPVIRSNYIANTAIIPVNALLQPALNDANFINAGTPYTINGANNGGLFNGVANLSQLATRLLQNGPTFSANALNNVDFTQPGGGTPRVNLNYTNNPIAPGAYTCYASSGGFLSPNVTRWWGLKNQALVAAQMTTFDVNPVAGADWDQIAIFNGSLNNGGVGVKVNVNTVNTYFLIALTTNGGRVSSHGIAATQTINENYQFGNQMTFSNSTGDFVISKNTALANNENWKVNLSALSSYYVQTIVNKVVRSIGEVRINSSIFEDYRLRINNVFNTFSLQNSAGTSTFLTVDTANDKVTLPRNTYYQAYLQDNAIATTIPANNTVTQLNLGGNLVVTSTSTPALANFNGLASDITILRAGVYKVDFNAVYLPDNSSDNCEMFINSNVGTYPAAYKRNRAIDGQYTQVTISFIHTFGANDLMFVAFRCAQNAPWTVNLTSWSLNITNLLVS